MTRPKEKTLMPTKDTDESLVNGYASHSRLVENNTSQLVPGKISTTQEELLQNGNQKSTNEQPWTSTLRSRSHRQSIEEPPLLHKRDSEAGPFQTGKASSSLG